PGLLEEEIINWQGRIVTQDGESSWIPLHSSRIASQNTMLNINISDDLNTTASLRRQHTNNFALQYRIENGGVTQDDILKSLEKDINLEVSDLKIDELDNPYKPVVETFSVDMSSEIENISNKIYFSPLSFLTMDENPFKSEERLFPIDFSFAREYKYMVNITIPESYSVEYLPESINVIFPENTGDFKFLINQQGNRIQLSVQEKIAKPVIQQSLYPDDKENFQN